MVIRQAIGAYPMTGDSIVPVLYRFGLESSTQIEWVASIMTMNTVFDFLHIELLLMASLGSVLLNRLYMMTWELMKP